MWSKRRLYLVKDRDKGPQILQENTDEIQSAAVYKGDEELLSHNKTVRVCVLRLLNMKEQLKIQEAGETEREKKTSSCWYIIHDL